MKLETESNKLHGKRKYHENYTGAVFGYYKHQATTGHLGKNTFN